MAAEKERENNKRVIIEQEAGSSVYVCGGLTMAGRNDWKWAAGGVEWGKEATVTGREKPRLFSTPRFDYSDQFPSLYRLFPLLGVGASFPLFLICPRLTELSGGVHSSPPGLRGYGWSTSQARQTEFLRKVTERGEQNDAEVGKGTRLASYVDLLNSLEQNKTREIRKGKKTDWRGKLSGITYLIFVTLADTQDPMAQW